MHLGPAGTEPGSENARLYTIRPGSPPPRPAAAPCRPDPRFAADFGASSHPNCDVRRGPPRCAPCNAIAHPVRSAESEATRSRIEPQHSHDSTMEPDMNRYDPRQPRALFAIAAVALTATTLALSVLAPAGVESIAPQDDLVTRVTSERCVPSDDTVVTGIDVVAVRAHHRSPVAEARDALVGLARS